MNALVTIAAPHGAGHTIFSPRHQAAFLENLSLNGNVRLACQAARVSPQTAYRARRSSPALARAWDAALLAARHVAEEVLADRALNGVEEAVFYHGEEIATRRRYDSRLLLAHLARLDKLAEQVDIADTLPLLDEQIEGLRRGEALAAPDPFVLRQAQDERGGAEARSTLRQAQGDRNTFSQDRVPGVPSCRDSATPPSSSGAVGRQKRPSSSAAVGRQKRPSSSGAVGRQEGQPCTECGGQCATPGAELTRDDCMWLGNRLDRMEAARPAGAPLPHQLGNDPGAIEARQLLAFEAGEDEWWLLVASAEPNGAG